MAESEALETFLGGKVRVMVGDITAQRVDAIVNAANSTLLGGGGVDGAIHRRGGAVILQECQEIRRTQYPRGLPTGEAVLTSGGRLAAQYVIHTVGPICRLGSAPDAAALASCYRKSLELAGAHGLRSIAFPAISTGAYAYPREEAAAVAAETIEEVLLGGLAVEEVRLIFYDAEDAAIFLRNHKFSTR
ncbi:MAG: O-acetyl-ADP-ribose deacetylase [Candidatus Acidiferrum sp.]|jgi:O-acetyl-ADP-ribose deacetylase (regulator of RNase III)